MLRVTELESGKAEILLGTLDYYRDNLMVPSTV